MGEQTRVIYERMARKNDRRSLLTLSREHGYWVVTNRLTGQKRYYAKSSDVWSILNRPVTGV